MAETVGNQGVGILSSLVRSNALLVAPEPAAVIGAGTTLIAQMSDWDL